MSTPLPTAPPARRSQREPVLIDLALQGGGSHGAFTWGVLDRLLEEPWLRIEGVSGTSAGAMNAAVLVDGHAKGGAEGARAALEDFWRQVARAGAFSPLRRGLFDVLSGRWTIDSNPVYMALDLASRMFSPYDTNPAGLNPLRSLLSSSVDFDRLAAAPIKLFVTATNVRTGRLRTFRNRDVTPDALLASACLPFMFQAVEIDGDAYWDGGYAGNPPISPLVRECDSNDTILVPINPIERAGTPRTAREIINRVNEVSFNASLLKELRMIALLRRVVNAGDREGSRWAAQRLHMIAYEGMGRLGVSSKLNAEWDFLCYLRNIGRREAGAFLAAHADALGRRATVDIERLLDEDGGGRKTSRHEEDEMDEKTQAATHEPTQRTQERARAIAGAAAHMMEGEATQMAGRAAESLAVAGELTQHVLHAGLELEANAIQEGTRCLAEQYRVDMDLAREFQEAAVRLQATWPEMMRDPMRWYLQSLEENAALTQKYLGAMRKNAELATQCLRRMEMSVEETSHAFRKAFKDAADLTPDALGTWGRRRAA